ncbi:MAG: hypothetical protein V2J42_02950 [Wenzhouxiangella sp.]|jgi:hypothetical protein|nr:hypothetical protein [Wenzhouxiangella sp.]
MKNFVELLAAWALFHESADEGWKAAVARGREQAPGAMNEGPDAFVEGLAALVDEEKERLKHRLAVSEAAPESGSNAALAERVEQLGFEIAALRGRMESLQASLDGIAERLPR